MNSLIPIINKLHDIYAKANLSHTIDLPQIVVVGGQSTGKSSVLELIVGKDFLPRGSGIVTRRPIILQLNHSIHQDDYAIFPDIGSKIFKDFNEVKKEIELQTEKIAGTNKGVSKEPLVIKIFSKNVVDLTLVDLPGLTKVPVGDQPNDIEKIIKSLIIEYIKKPSAIILAITAANTDLANSDSLKLAREYDPQGDRTIGVLTKLDIMDQGTDALDIFQGKVYPLKLGYIGVVCRSQKDINDNKSMNEATEAEKAFFSKHPKYNSFSDKMGISYLSNTLNKLLVNHIKNCIPSLKNSINELLRKKEKELFSFGDDIFNESEDNNKIIILKLIQKFVEYYSSTIEGQIVKESTIEFLGGARISYIFNEIFAKSLYEMNPFDIVNDDDIRTAIKNAKGLKPNLFLPELAFEILIKQQISRLKQPSLDCVKMIYEELKKIVLNAEIPELSRYHKLQAKILDVFDNVLYKCLGPTDLMIKNLIKVEESYINVNHPDFIRSTNFLMLQNNEENENAKPESKKNNSSEIPEKLKSNKQSELNSKKGSEKDTNKNLSKLPSIFKLLGNGNSNNNNPGNEEAKQMSEFQLVDAELNDQDSSKKRSFDSNIPIFALPSIPQSMRSSLNPSDRDKMETAIIKHMILSYFNVIRKNICDLVPKSIMAFLINESKSTLQQELVVDLYKESNLKELLVENPIIYEKRIQCKKNYELYQESLKILNEIKEVHI